MRTIFHGVSLWLMLSILFFILPSFSKNDVSPNKLELQTDPIVSKANKLVLDGKLGEESMKTLVNDLLRSAELTNDHKTKSAAYSAIAYYKTFFEGVDSAMVFATNAQKDLPKNISARSKVLLFIPELCTSFINKDTSTFERLSILNDSLSQWINNKNIQYRYIRTKRLGRSIIYTLNKDEILDYIREVQVILEQLNVESLILFDMDIAVMYRKIQELDLSIEYCFSAIENAKKNGFSSRRDAFIYRTLGQNFSDIGEYRKAAENFDYANESAINYDLNDMAELNKAFANEARFFTKEPFLSNYYPDNFVTEDAPIIHQVIKVFSAVQENKMQNAKKAYEDLLALKEDGFEVYFELAKLGTHGIELYKSGRPDRLDELYHTTKKANMLGWSEIVLDSLIRMNSRSNDFESLSYYQNLKLSNLDKNVRIRNRSDIIHKAYEISFSEIDDELVKQNDQLIFEKRLKWGAFFLTALLGFLLYGVSQLRRNEQRKNAQLTRLNNDIKVKEERLTEYIDERLQLENFAYLASHDLKSPLQNVINFSSLLTNSVQDKLNDREKSYLDFIHQGTERMKLTIEDLLHFSLAKNKELKLETFNPQDLLSEVKEDIQSLIDKSKANISAEGFPNEIIGDRSLIKQLLQNLLTNAMKFVPDSRSPVIKVRYDIQEDFHHFSISDNGIGISEENKKSIFGIFKRLHLKEEYDGTGIGLAICKLIVEKHSGKMNLESKLGLGSTFGFTLPMS